MKNNKRNLWFLLLLFFSLTVNKTRAQGIVFVHNIDSALTLAKKNNKPVFIDFYTSWCAPCKVMTNEVFPQQKVGAYFNSRFINCKIQCDDNGAGVEVGKKYQVNAYPTLMFLNTNGELIHSVAGGFSAESLIDIANIALDTKKNLRSLLVQWDNGKRDTAFVKEYFATLKTSYRIELAKSQFESYFKRLPAGEQTSPFVFKLTKLLGYSVHSSMFSFIEDNLAAFKKRIGVAEAEYYVTEVYRSYLREMVLTKGTEARKAYYAAKADFSAKSYPGSEKISTYISIFETVDTTGKMDIKEYQRRGTAFLDKYGAQSDAYTISLAGLLANYTVRENEGAAGITWMENLLARNRNPQYLNTYFYILWRNYQIEKAITVGEEMRTNAIRENQPTKPIDDQIAMVNGLREKREKLRQAAPTLTN